MPFSGFGKQMIDKTGPYYDADRVFEIELARPDQASRSLANVIDDWELLGDELAQVDNAKGLHHMENVKFKQGEYTPLLYARTADGQQVPLAVASYPGKGRAIWLFSDTLWRLAMQSGSNVPRQAYHRFLQASMQWLMREEIRKPLVAKNFRLTGGTRGEISWQVELQGPATKYFRRDSNWEFSVCGQKINFDDFNFERIGVFEVLLSGQLNLTLAGGQRCNFSTKADHVAFGSVDAAISEVFPRTFADDEVGGSKLKLQELVRLTGAEFISQTDVKAGETFDAWLGSVTGTEGLSLPSRFKSSRNFYWVLERWWFWALMLLLPIEMIIRKWHQLSGTALRVSPTKKLGAG
jgi:hypothetical protein